MPPEIVLALVLLVLVALTDATIMHGPRQSLTLRSYPELTREKLREQAVDFLCVARARRRYRSIPSSEDHAPSGERIMYCPATCMTVVPLFSAMAETWGRAFV
jgi:hypothetical protein